MKKMDSVLNDIRWMVKWRDEIKSVNACRSHLFIVEEVRRKDVNRHARFR
jgi:hypothetical protein